MKKKTIITVIVILFLCVITWTLSDFFSGRSSDQAGDDSRKATANGQAEERSTEDSSTDTKMDMGTEQPSENLDNEVTIPDDWGE